MELGIVCEQWGVLKLECPSQKLVLPTSVEDFKTQSQIWFAIMINICPVPTGELEHPPVPQIVQTIAGFGLKT